MKKLLLLGTIFVATGALAFGGGGGGSALKSTTYKGGVNAIGVHFNSNETSKIQITECPENMETYHTELGLICCKKDYPLLCLKKNDQGDCTLYTCKVPPAQVAVCEPGEALYCGQQECNAYGARCCPSNKIVSCAKMEYGACVVSGCCPVGQSAYTSGSSAWCCPSESLYCSQRNADGSCAYQGCCGTNGHIFEHIGINQADLCCATGQVPTCAQGETGPCERYVCCSEGQTARLSSSYYNGYKCCDGHFENELCISE